METIKNLEKALAGESMAYIKYRYFAEICRVQGDEATANLFEETAKQEVLHALGHMNLLFPKEQLNVQKCLALAIEGETYEYAEMYPEFRHMAEREGQNYAVLEFSEQIEESKQHAKIFEEMLLLAKKRFAALTKVEERHARQYEDRLANLNK